MASGTVPRAIVRIPLPAPCRTVNGAGGRTGTEQRQDAGTDRMQSHREPSRHHRMKSLEQARFQNAGTDL